MTERRYARRYPYECGLCECGHRSLAEAIEIHDARDRIHAALKERTVLVMNAPPVEPGKIFIRPPKQALVPRAKVEASR